MPGALAQNQLTKLEKVPVSFPLTNSAIQGDVANEKPLHWQVFFFTALKGTVGDFQLHCVWG